jgi:hypothetical protein
MQFSKITIQTLIALTFLIPIIDSCDKEKIEGDIVTDPQLLAKIYTESLDTLVLKSGVYILETYLYRDFFPGGPIPRRTPLIASVKLFNTDSLPVSADLEIRKLYVVNQQQIWISEPGDGKQTNVPEYKIEKLNNNGPEWETGIFVDVVLEIENKLTAIRYFLIARNQRIERLD